jgi:DNA-binding NtrC family response regulator
MIHGEEIHLVITDLVMPEVDGMHLLEIIRREFKGMRVILLTAHGTVEAAVQAIKFGAVDFILKPVDFEALLSKVRNNFQELELIHEFEERRKQCPEGKCADCDKLVGETRIWKKVLKQAEKLATSEVNILITGESGTGKEVLARWIHKLSRRKEQSFVPVNCGGLPETLLESELFGMVKGAYSGALRDREGLIRTAKGGTVFLDEISELTLSSQAKLLRVLQDGEVRPLGSDKTLKADCRFLAATNRELKEEMQKGTFREDLFYRIASFVIQIPPLRERWEDIPLLAKHFVYCQSVREGKPPTVINSEALSILQSYPWPGNVRQLENVIKRALIFKEGDVLKAEDFSLEIFETTHKTYTPGLKEILNRFERSYIIRVLNEQRGDKRTTAEKLKVSLTTLYQKIKDLEIPADEISGISE